jgi:hypothetical protein
VEIFVSMNGNGPIGACPCARRPRQSRPEPKEEKMRVISQTELMRLSRAELMVLQRRIAGELVNLPENSTELRNAHVNLVNIRRALIPAPGPRP